MNQDIACSASDVVMLVIHAHLNYLKISRHGTKTVFIKGDVMS